MKAIPKWIFLVVAVALTYWTSFFGEELILTLRLYQKGIAVDEINTTSLPHHHIEVSELRSTVPLIMHRMWRDDSILDGDVGRLDSGAAERGPPTNWSKAFSRCNNLHRHTHWTTILWTDDSLRAFIGRHYPSFLSVYDSYPYDIQRADAARYFVLYHYGGVYLDLDLGCREHGDLRELLSAMERRGKVALAPATEPVGVSNDVLCATRGSPFFKDLMENLPAKNAWYGSPYLTGTILLRFSMSNCFKTEMSFFVRSLQLLAHLIFATWSVRASSQVLYSTGPMFLSLRYARMPPANQNEVLILPRELCKFASFSTS